MDFNADLRYAWAELEVAPGGTQITLKGYAYESTPDTPIIAGDNGMSTAVQDVNAGANMDLYPNPATDRLSIMASEEFGGAADVRIVGLTGQVMQTGTVVIGAGPQAASLDVASLPAGAYVVELRQGDRVERREFIKQ